MNMIAKGHRKLKQGKHNFNILIFQAVTILVGNIPVFLARNRVIINRHSDVTDYKA